MSGSPPSTGRAPLETIVAAGARPNFMKVAPVIRALKRRGGEFAVRLVHTGQHYDESLSDTFFRELKIDAPEKNLGAGSGGHAEQTARILEAFDDVLAERRPHLVVVVGDVNSTLACALAAAKRLVPVAHVEAGLRSFDRRMPEELNRVLTDALSDFLFVTEESGMENLAREGLSARAFLVGNVMIDTLLENRDRAARESKAMARLGVAPGSFVLVTLHRPENVDDASALREIASALETLAAERPIIFPVHPRTRGRLEAAGLASRLEQAAGARLSGPMPYLDFVNLLANAALVLTDSGGIQEEAAVLGTPCLTVRGSTERPSTLAAGRHRLVQKLAGSIVASARELSAAGRAKGPVPSLWDGKASERIAEILSARQDEIRRGGSFAASSAAVSSPGAPRTTTS